MSTKQELWRVDVILQWMENKEANYSVDELRNMASKAREMLKPHIVLPLVLPPEGPPCK